MNTKEVFCFHVGDGDTYCLATRIDVQPQHLVILYPDGEHCFSFPSSQESATGKLCKEIVRAMSFARSAGYVEGYRRCRSDIQQALGVSCTDEPTLIGQPPKPGERSER